MTERTDISVYFRPEDKELYDWVESLAQSGYNKNQVVRNALACYRQTRHHAGPLTWQEWLSQASELMRREQSNQAVINAMEGENGQ